MKKEASGRILQAEVTSDKLNTNCIRSLLLFSSIKKMSYKLFLQNIINNLPVHSNYQLANIPCAVIIL